jgi:hypothetical protein
VFDGPKTEKIFNDLVSMFYPRLVRDFLSNFIGEEMAEIYLKICDAFYCKFNDSKGEKVFSESLTTFSYFHRCTKVVQPVDFTRAMLYRGCARITPHYYPGTDLILPLVSGDDKLGNILVQVKFVDEHYFYKKYTDLEDKLRIEKMRELLGEIENLDDWNSAKLENILSFSEGIARPFFRKEISHFYFEKAFGPIKRQPEPVTKVNVDEDLSNRVEEMNIEGPKEDVDSKKVEEIEAKGLNQQSDDGKTFPSLRIFINIKEDAKNISSIEFDQFGPILLIETNGKHNFLEPKEQDMIESIIKKTNQETRKRITVQELEGQNFFPDKGRTANDPINPIYYKETIDSDWAKLSLSYFHKHRVDLKKEYEGRPKFLQNFEKLVKTSESSNEPNMNQSIDPHTSQELSESQESESYDEGSKRSCKTQTRSVKKFRTELE